ncbi:hypothetical protein GCM10017771_20920 [Streptomyces capitiformicae]|uniref:Uncharacterized protein n=1 Tax=Streptomyces capitiformicae TaxID=2014920 RepID=A0A919GL52_9ACTN|nr:hypothetical protein GCM10017771_20920 [Streptomyces capitiformicae]
MTICDHVMTAEAHSARGALAGAAPPYGRPHRLSQCVTPSRLLARGSVDMGTWSVSWVDLAFHRPVVPLLSARTAGTAASGAWRTHPWTAGGGSPGGARSRGCGRR